MIRAGWLRVDRRVRYLLVGGWNSVVAYVTFAACWFALNAWMPAPLIVVTAYLLASVNGYLTFRYLVFGPARHPVTEYVRYQAVYLPLLAANVIILPIALSVTDLSAYVIQLLFSVVAIVVAYLGNRFFVFAAGGVR